MLTATHSSCLRLDWRPTLVVLVGHTAGAARQPGAARRTRKLIAACVSCCCEVRHVACNVQFNRHPSSTHTHTSLVLPSFLCLTIFLSAFQVLVLPLL